VSAFIFDKDTWSKFAAGYFVRDCTIGFDEGRLGFLLYEELAPDADLGEGWQIRVLAVKLANPFEKRFYSMSANKLIRSPSLTSVWGGSNGEFVAVGSDRECYSYRPNSHKGIESAIKFQGGKLHPEAYGEFDSVTYKTVRVGSTVFAVGAPFRIFERIAGQQWREHKEIPIPVELGARDHDGYIHAISNCDFRDLGGLSPDDMYAVGSAGTVWRRKAGQWRQLAFPTNLRLHTVAVAPDGTAYITDIRGSVWQGQDEKWQRIVHVDNMLAYEDSAWFAGRLWCTNDSAGPFVLEGKEMVPAHRAKNAPMPAEIAQFAHRIDVSPDGKTMLVAGMHGAALYDGSTWTVLFNGEPDA
jgi:hypothetical protein